jgi:hypothetical protein
MLQGKQMFSKILFIFLGDLLLGSSPAKGLSDYHFGPFATQPSLCLFATNAFL